MPLGMSISIACPTWTNILSKDIIASLLGVHANACHVYIVVSWIAGGPMEAELKHIDFTELPTLSTLALLVAVTCLCIGGHGGNLLRWSKDRDRQWTHLCLYYWS
jgi:hypothetical protein